jgi:hypothetical protein
VTARAPKTRTAPVPASADDDGVLRITTSTNQPVEEARRTLFVIDDEDFTVPKVIDERLVYLAMNYMRTEGAVFGAMHLTELLLGERQYKQLNKLYERKEITQEQFDDITKRVNDLFFNHVNGSEDEEGKASPASPSD